MPPDKFRHWTSRQLDEQMSSANPDWSGQAWMDSARYS
jgi:hypothetical protein